MADTTQQSIMDRLLQSAAARKEDAKKFVGRASASPVTFPRGAAYASLIPIGMSAMDKLPDQPTGALGEVLFGAGGAYGGYKGAQMASPFLRKMGPWGQVADIGLKVLAPLVAGSVTSDLGGNLAEGVKQAFTGEPKKRPGTTQARGEKTSALKYELGNEALKLLEEGRINRETTLQMLKGIQDIVVDSTGQLTSIASEENKKIAERTMMVNEGIMDQLLRAGHLGTGKELAIRGQAIAGNLAGAVLSNNPYSGAFLNPSVQVTI